MAGGRGSLTSTLVSWTLTSDTSWISATSLIGAWALVEHCHESMSMVSESVSKGPEHELSGIGSWLDSSTKGRAPGWLKWHFLAIGELIVSCCQTGLDWWTSVLLALGESLVSCQQLGPVHAIIRDWPCLIPCLELLTGDCTNWGFCALCVEVVVVGLGTVTLKNSVAT